MVLGVNKLNGLGVPMRTITGDTLDGAFIGVLRVMRWDSDKNIALINGFATAAIGVIARR